MPHFLLYDNNLPPSAKVVSVFPDYLIIENVYAVLKAYI